MASASSAHETNWRGQYGFAKLDNDIVLVQLDSSAAGKTYQVHVFRHSFVSVFCYSHTQNIPHSDLLDVLEGEENGKRGQCWLEEDTATVFVAQDGMSRFVRHKDMLVPAMGSWRPTSGFDTGRRLAGYTFGPS